MSTQSLGRYFQPIRLLVYIATLTVALVGWDAERIVQKQDDIEAALNRMVASSAMVAQRVEDMSSEQRLIAGKIDDHEHRITVLESTPGRKK